MRPSLKESPIDSIEKLTHLECKLGLGNRLLQEINSFIQSPLVDDRVSRISRHIKDLQARPDPRGSLAELSSVDGRHYNIREHEIHYGLLLQQNRQCRLRAWG
jgi:hypothetical protein